MNTRLLCILYCLFEGADLRLNDNLCYVRLKNLGFINLKGSRKSLTQKGRDVCNKMLQAGFDYVLEGFEPSERVTRCDRIANFFGDHRKGTVVSVADGRAYIKWDEPTINSATGAKQWHSTIMFRSLIKIKESK